jgi:topoisomerase-4 subunit A
MSEQVEIKHFASKAYLAYAMSVVRSRALPQVQDGQKPVHRRILYTMYKLGIDDKSKHVKSARIVGEALGKYHPHGDSSVYEAMVRMSQDFTLRYPLMDGQGNFGSRDGDGAAAMRYTEIRLAPIASLLLDELKYDGVVDLIPNYDGFFVEPTLLPSRLPFILLNGASGIAVGMATEIPSHNLREVSDACIYYIKNKENTTIENLLEFIKGPDFSNYGQIISSREEIVKAYETGRGSFRVRGTWKTEKLSDGTVRVILNSLPQSSSTAKILMDIDSVVNPKNKAGKTKLLPEQVALKQKIESMIEKVRDESDEKNPVRIVIEAKSSSIKEMEIINFLSVYTCFEVNISMNMVMIGNDKKPKQKNILNIVSEWVDFRRETVTKRLNFRLNQINDRIHILEGRLIALGNIDRVIDIIKNDNDAKTSLMTNFNLSVVQAEDILEMKLRQISNLEGEALTNQAKELSHERDGINILLNNKDRLDDLIVKEITEDANKFGDNRRTIVEEAQKGSMDFDASTNEPVTLIFSKNGWLRQRSGHKLNLDKVDFKSGDSLSFTIECKENTVLALVNNQGNLTNLKVSEIPSGRGDGRHIGSIINGFNMSNINKVIPIEPKEKYLIVSKAGNGFICTSDDLITRNIDRAFISLSDDDLIHDIIKVDKTKTHIYFTTGPVKESKGYRILCYAVSDIKELPKGKGTRLIDVSDTHIEDIVFTDERDFKMYPGKRGQKGKVY